MSLANLQTETLVYWSPGTPDGFGHMSFGTPVEILSRYQDRVERAVDDTGQEFVSRATIYPASTLALNGWVYRGTLAELTAEYGSVPANPQNVVGAYRIRTQQRSQNPSGGIVVRKNLLGG